MNFKQLITKTIIWRLFLLIVAAAAINLLPFKDSFPYRESILEPFGHPLFYSWGNFDGVHYLGIARQGYFADFTQAFFPLYPSIVRVVNTIFNNYLFSSLFVSHLTLVAALMVFYRLIRLDYSKAIATRTITFLLLFPTSFYFGSVYTESLFLLLTTLTFYYQRKNLKYAAIITAALATSTRFVGIFLIPAMIAQEYFSRRKKSPKINLKHYLPYLLSATGLLIYMNYLNQNFSDPLYFINSQPAFGAQRSTDKLILLYQVIFRYFRMITTVPIKSLLFYTVFQEFFLSVSFISMAIYSLKKLKPSYAYFSLLVLITPTLTGTFSSMPRYVLAAFPIFIILGQIKSKTVRNSLYILSAILLAVNVALFTRGYWIS